VDSDKLNRWLTLVANVGVLIGIVLILLELNQNADMMRAQMAQSRAETRIELFRTMMDSEYWPAILTKQRNASSRQEWIDSLTPEESERVRSRTIMQVNNVRTQYHHFKEGYLDESLFNTSVELEARRLVVDLQFFPDIRISSPEFVDYLNSIARKYGLKEYQQEAWVSP
jgi:hypothetical protein